MEWSDEQVRIWSVPDGRLERCLFAGGDGVVSLSASPDGKLLAAGYTHRLDGQNWVAVLDWSSGRPRAYVTGDWSEPNARWSVRQHMLVVVAGRNVEVWDLQDPASPHRKWHKESFWYDRTESE